jgi:hypothetical protein
MEKENISSNYEKKTMFNQYQIKIISQIDSILLSIDNSYNIFESIFNLEDFDSLKSFISNITIRGIIDYISKLIDEKKIKIEESESNLKLICDTINPLELILNKKNSDNNNINKDNNEDIKKIKVEEKIISKSQLNNNNLKLIKTLNLHKDWITKILIFPLGNIISVSYDNSINYYDSNFNLLQKIQNAHNKGINYIDIKDENNFVTCSIDKTIKTWIKKENKFQINKIIINAHDQDIIKVLYYSNINLISCSIAKNIKIWEEKDNNYQSVTALTHNDYIFSFLILEDKKILVSGGEDGIIFWKLNNFEFIIHIEKTYCGSCNSLCRINKDYIIVNGRGNRISLKVISISQKNVVKEIFYPYTCYGLCYIKSKRIFLVGGVTRDLKIYEIDNFKCIQTIKDAHFNFISGFLELNNGNIISYGNKNQSVIWSF